jgi:hypothetical protein
MNVPYEGFISGAPPAGAEGSYPKRDIPRLAESIQPLAEAEGFLQRGKGEKSPVMYSINGIKNHFK